MQVVNVDDIHSTLTAELLVGVVVVAAIAAVWV